MLPSAGKARGYVLAAGDGGQRRGHVPGPTPRRESTQNVSSHDVKREVCQKSTTEFLELSFLRNVYFKGLRVPFPVLLMVSAQCSD